MRTLIAGFGNVLRGDDGFGVEVIRRLEASGVAGEGVELLDVGTGGIHLAHALLARYDQLIVIDAVSRASAPGTLTIRLVEQIAAATDIDMHTTVPSRALAVAQALGGLPPRVLLVGCEPDHATLEEPLIGLSPAVSTAADEAVARIQRLVATTADV